MSRILVIAGASAFFALSPIAGESRDAAAAARIWYGTCFPQFESCLARCAGLQNRAFDRCTNACLRPPRCDSEREIERREAQNGNLPESALPGGYLPGSQLPSGNLPSSRLP
ncbi:hypothetical protein [Taklimakanibacter lacteus]|uniref:hypothetical protein n=1 Tax=Taklimakanibacter lacteus TaxID=2268456 RepID=UPI000E66008A